MDFLDSRADQLANYLREEIAQGKLMNPLPASREWARHLGVGCRTLYAALEILKQEKWIETKLRQGYFVNPLTERPPDWKKEKTLRVVYQSADYSDLLVQNRWGDLLYFLSQRLQPHGILLTLEKCTDRRLRTLSDLPPAACRHELLLLRSLSAAHQRRFASGGRPSLVFGYCSPEIGLPYINFDLDGAIRHATHRFFRMGYSHVYLLINKGSSHGVHHQHEVFSKACASWGNPSVSGEIVSVPVQPDAQFQMLRRFASRIRPKQGILVVAPVALPSVIVSILKYRGDIFHEIETVSVGGRPDPVCSQLATAHYDISLPSAIRAISHRAVEFFKHGSLSGLSKTIPLEISGGN